MKAEKDSRYVSYFQSVTTVGIINHAKNLEEAESKAKETMKNPDATLIGGCLFEQTPLELSDTEEWSPEIESEHSNEGVVFRFNPDEVTKGVIAKKLGKKIDDLTELDINKFVKESIDVALG